MQDLIEQYQNGPSYQREIANKLKMFVDDEKINKHQLLKDIKILEKQCFDSVRNKFIWQTFKKDVNFILDNIKTLKTSQIKFFLPSQQQNIKLQYITCLQLEDFRNLLSEYFKIEQIDFVDRISFFENQIRIKFYDVNSMDEFEIDSFINSIYQNDTESENFSQTDIAKLRKEIKEDLTDEEAEKILNKRTLKIQKYYQPFQIQTDVEQFLQTQFQNVDKFIVRFVCRCSVMTNKDIIADYLQQENFPIEFQEICQKICDYFSVNRNKRQISMKYNTLTLIKLPKDEKASMKRIKFYKEGQNDYQSRKNTMIQEELMENWINQYIINMQHSYKHRKDIIYQENIYYVQKIGHNKIFLNENEIKKYIYPFVDEEIQSKIIKSYVLKNKKGLYFMYVLIPYIFKDQECSETSLLDEQKYRWVSIYSNKYIYTLIRNRFINENCQEPIEERNFIIDINQFSQQIEGSQQLKEFIEENYYEEQKYQQKMKETSNVIKKYNKLMNKCFEEDEIFEEISKEQKQEWMKQQKEIYFNSEDVRDKKIINTETDLGTSYSETELVTETKEQREQRLIEYFKNKGYVDYIIFKERNPTYSIDYLENIKDELTIRYEQEQTERRKSQFQTINDVFYKGYILITLEKKRVMWNYPSEKQKKQYELIGYDPDQDPDCFTYQIWAIPPSQ